MAVPKRFYCMKVIEAPNYKLYFDLEAVILKIKSYLKDFDEKAFRKAFSFAEEAHRGQLRKDGLTPYLLHPVSVVEILAGLHADQDILISALLHDVPEDTTRTLEEVEELFGKDVAYLVDGITKLATVHYEHNMSDRKIDTLKKLFIHTAKDPRVIIIKLADRLHNMRTLDFIPPEKQARTSMETLEIFVPAANLLGIQVLKASLEDLCFKYLFPSEYEKLKTQIQNSSKELDSYIKDFQKSVKNILKLQNVNSEVFVSDKTIFGIYKKICDLGRTIDFVDDRVLVKVIVDNIEDCYKALGLIHGKFIPKTDRFKDYIANPKVNGYRCLHTIVFGVKGLLTEIHIQTKDMQLEADFGIAANFFSNDDGKKNKHLISDSRSTWINKILEIEKGGVGSEFMEDLKSDILEERIIVFTPKGSTIDLPKGASAIDFAYAISSSVGDNADKVIINDIIKPITSTLRANDVVKITVSENSAPELYWLNFVKTNFAKNKIKIFFKRESEEKRINIGASIFQREFDIAGMGIWKDFSFRKINSLFGKELKDKYKKWNELFAAIGGGEITAADVVKSITDKYQKGFSSSSLLNRILHGKNKDRKTVYLKIVAFDRTGLASDIVHIVDRNSVNMNLFKGWHPFFMKYAYFQVRIFVDKPKIISRIFNEIRQVDGVLSVTRIRLKSLLIFYAALAFTVGVWISHSYILKVIIEIGFANVNSFLAYTLLYVEIFLPLLSVLFLTNILRKYFPLMRNRKLMWITSFVVLSGSILNLAYKVSKLHLEVSWIVLGVGVLATYSYLFYLYRKLNTDSA